MMNNFAAYVDLDVHKDTITVAITAAKRSGKVRSLRAQTRSVQTAFILGFLDHPTFVLTN